MPTLIEPIAIPIPQACNFIGVGRSTMYKLINTGEVETIAIGKRRLIVVESLKSLVASKTNEAM